MTGGGEQPERAGDGEWPGEVRKTQTGTDTSTPEPLTSSVPGLLELDHVFEVLSHRRRRYLLYALATNPEWTLTELATKLAAWEQGLPEDDVEPSTRERVYHSLYHAHVPYLVEEGVVRFGEDTETLARGETVEEVFAVLDRIDASLDTAQQQHAEQDYTGEADGYE